MRGSPWYLARRFSKKARLTTVGIAVCVAFTVLSFTVVSGLRSTTYDVSNEFRSRDWIVSAPSFEPFDPIVHGLREGTFVLLTEATLADGRRVTLAAFEARDLRPIPPDTIQPGDGLALPRGNVTLTAPSDHRLAVGAPFKSNYSQSTWGVVSPATLRSIDERFGRYSVTYVLLRNFSAAQESQLADEGLVARPVPSVVPFFDSGAREVIRDLWLVVVFSSVLVAILAFEFMHMETRARRREIGIWRALGLRNEAVLRVLLGQAALLALLGVVAGSASALALVFVAREATGLAILDPRPDPLLLGAVLLSILVSTLAGAYVPARKASRELVREALEGAR